ncbi:hypothetical protein [Nocardioides euryhalodurans]|uniref:WD40 repeat domain-containing protein n=1 Tax=Nocardioides euryhalodurans TaxID=2518370 RepID=A0A4P7GPB2_9ACTN|nr:hypothetical protein [Nocardioides euryhalodurans]QBR93960.1 hypothetical protein EXE57_17990 [Nocardioides euryhalodurans]
MTERLSQLLHEEATHLASPVPDPAPLAHAGRRLRRRRQVTTGVAVAASVVVVAGGSVLLGLGDRGDREVQPVDVDRDAIVWGYGDTVHLDDVTASVPGTLLTLNHTSVGVLAVSTTADAELAGPGRLTLVRYDGTTEDLGELEAGAHPATDPGRDVYVLAETRGPGRAVIVRDAQTGEVREELEVPGLDGARPPMALDGDTLYVRAQPRRMLTVDLVSGEVAPAIRATYYSDATRDRVVTGDRRTFRVVDVGTGEELMSVPTAGTLLQAELSPDARFLRVVRAGESRGVGYEYAASRTLEAWEVASGQPIDVDLGDASADSGGWTLSGDLYTLTDTGVVRCDVPEGTCEETRIEDLPELAEPSLADPVPLDRIVLPDELL